MGADTFGIVPPEHNRKKERWVETYSRLKLYPFDPAPEQICLKDIAQGLSRLPRFTGQLGQFYSIAEHSIRVCAEISDSRPANVKLWALLHDAPEAYLGDIPSPVKTFIPAYIEAEDLIMRAICDKYGLPRECPPEVNEADKIMLSRERATLKMADRPWPGEAYFGAAPFCASEAMPPDVAREVFMDEVGHLLLERPRAEEW